LGTWDRRPARANSGGQGGKGSSIDGSCTMRGGVNDRRSRPIGSLRLRVGGGGGGAATGWPGPRARGGGGGSRVERLAGWRKDATRGGVVVGGFRRRAPGPAKARSAAAARDVCRRRSPAVAAAAWQGFRPQVGARCRVGWLHGHAGRRATPAAAWPMLLGADDTRVWVGVVDSNAIDDVGVALPLALCRCAPPARARLRSPPCAP
jgi:hypothetical protein